MRFGLWKKIIITCIDGHDRPHLKLGLGLSFLCRICFDFIDGAVPASSLSEICGPRIHNTLRLLAETAPSMKSKQIRHKKDKPSPNCEIYSM